MNDQFFPKPALNTRRWKNLISPVIERCHHAIRKDRFPHSVLITGPMEMGRELAAVEIAAMLITGQAPWSNSPETSRVRQGIHPDLTVLFGQGKKDTIRIEAIREVVRSAPGRPFEGLRRVWVLDRAENSLETSAANALLKVLEEPPDHVVFLLLADNPQSLLPTILSRCSRLKLPGAVGIASQSTTPGGIPPEVIHRVGSRKGMPELLEEIRDSLVKILAGDRMEALGLAAKIAEKKNAMEFCAAVGLEMAAEGDSRSEEAIRLAQELLRCDQLCRSYSLKRQRQMASILLKKAEGL